MRMLTATVGKSSITKGYCKRLRTHSRQSERPKIMGVWRCKVSLRYGIRNNVGLYRCRLRQKLVRGADHRVTPPAQRSILTVSDVVHPPAVHRQHLCRDPT